MPFVPDAPSSGGTFVPDNEESLGGLAKNAWEDTKNTAKGVWDLTGRMIDHPVDTAVETAKALPGAVMDEGKRLGVGKLFTEGPVAAGQQFRKAAYEKPVSTLLDVLPAAGAAGKALKAGEMADVAADVARMAPKAVDNVASELDDAARTIPKPPPGPEMPPPPTGGPSAAPGGAPPPPPPGAAAAVDPLKEVSDFITKKYGQAASKPGLVERAGDVLTNFAGDVRGKDLGLRPGQVQSMGQGFKGIEKAEQLLDYADSKGYFKPGLSDASRKAQIKAVLDQTGKQIGAVRDIASTRGKPPLPQILNEVKTQLTKEFGTDAPGEVKRVLAKIQMRMKENPTFSGMADLATELNKAKTPAKAMGQHPGPTTEAANIVARMNNDATRALLNPKESELFTNALRDFGAHKKLEQAVANSARRSMTGRSGQLGSLTNRLVQNILDSGGYRLGGKVAGSLGKAMKANPDRFKTLPQFFEELGHHADDALDDAIEGGMADGGIVGYPRAELHDFLSVKYAPKKETH